MTHVWLVTAAALLLSAVSNAAQAAAAGNTLLVFTTEVDGQWDLFSWDPDGAEAPRALTSTPIDELRPSLSGDLELVAFTDSAGHAWVQRLSDRHRVRLTTDSQRGLVLSPSLDARGTAALLSMRDDPGHDVTDLVLVPLKGIELDRGPLDFELGPAWSAEGEAGSFRLRMDSSQFSPAFSPDARSMVFTHLHSKWGGRVIAEIWHGRVDISECRQLTLTDGLCEDAAWSPDGERVVFSSDREQQQFDLWCVDVRTRELERWTDGPFAEIEPCFSPEGDRLVFVSLAGGRPSLSIMELESHEIRPLRPFPDEGRAVAAPCWR